MTGRRVFYTAPMAAIELWRLFEQSGVRTIYVTEQIRIKYLNVFLYNDWVNKEELLYLLTVAKLND